MAETGAIRAGGAFVEIFAKDAALMKGLNASAAKFKAWGATLTKVGMQVAKVGVAASAALFGTLKVFADQGDSLAKMSQRTGISVEALSELGYAADQSGTSIDNLEKSVRKMQQGLTNAVDDGGAAAEAFTRLGLSVEDLQRLNPEQQFLAVAEQLAKVQDPTLKAALAVDLFGKSGTEMLPMLADGAEGIDALRKRARDLGLTMSTEAAFGAVAFGDNMADVWKQVKKVTFEIGAALAPTLKDLIGRFQQSLTGVIRWVKENQGLVSIALKVAAGIVAVGVSLVTVGYIFKAASLAISAVAVALGLLTNPIAVAGAAIVGLGAIVLKESGAFATLAEDATEAFDGIKAALESGDMGKAVAVAWAFIKLEWQRGVEAVKGLWFGFIESIEVAWANAVEFISGAASSWFANAVDGLNEIGRMVGLIDDATANATSNVLQSDDARRQQAIADAGQAAREAAVARGQAALADAEENLRRAKAALTKEAKEATEMAAKSPFKDSSSLAGGPGGYTSDGEDMIGVLRNLSTKGIFNPQAIQSLQGGGPQAKPQEKAAKALERLVGVAEEQEAIQRRTLRAIENLNTGFA